MFAGGLLEEETGTPYEEETGTPYEEVGGAYKECESNAFGVLDLEFFFATSAVLLLWTGGGIWITQLGGGELTTDSCWIVSLGVVDGLGVQLTLGSSLVGLLAWGFTFDAWGFSTLEDGEEELLLQVAVTLSPLVDVMEAGDNGATGGFEAWPKSF